MSQYLAHTSCLISIRIWPYHPLLTLKCSSIKILKKIKFFICVLVPPPKKKKKSMAHIPL